NGRLLEAAWGPAAQEVLRRTQNVHIVACGTSFHAASCARYFIEQVAKIPCSVDIASEYRYRSPLVPPNSLFVTISQSGETADTLAALRLARQSGYLSSLAICNVPESSLVRESELVMLTRAGPEIGVASTKAFTTQLAALGMLVIALARHNGADAERERGLVTRLIELPGLVEKTLELDAVIRRLAERFVFAASESGIRPSDGVTVIEMPRRVSYVQAPVVYTIPLQLLAYHVAILRGTDVDQPRNLAKSVTVE